MNDLVSIITPSYNTAKYINETIESVLNQTYSNWEMIIVDDCSIDNTEKVVKSYCDDRIIFIKNQVNCGAAVSRNKGIEKAKGRWIAFLDSDDLWVRNKLEKQVRFMDENNIFFSYTKYSEMDESAVSNGKVVSGPHKINRRSMYNYCWPGCLTVMYDAKVIGKIQVADLKKNNDYAIWLKIIDKADCFLLDENLASYRLRKNSISRQSYFRLLYHHYLLFREGNGSSVVGSLCGTVRNVFFGVVKKVWYVKKENFDDIKGEYMDWKYYNHAIISALPPHLIPDVTALDKKYTWCMGKGITLFARWTTDFDCKETTEFWYIIKDEKFDLEKIKSKRRYEIKLGLRYSYVKKINPKKYLDELFNIYLNAVKEYKNNNYFYNREVFCSEVLRNTKRQYEYWGVFLNDTDQLVGYSCNMIVDNYVEFVTMKFDPQYLNKRISAALVYQMVVEYLNIRNFSYINDGARSVRHETNFQDFLIKYFGFRKAYCKLHIRYRPIIALVVKVLYHFKKLLKNSERYRWIQNMISVLEMESIRRSF